MNFWPGSWKYFHGCGILNHTLVLCGTVSWVKISWFASQPQKPQKFYHLKNTRHTVYEGCPDLLTTGSIGILLVPQLLARLNTTVTITCKSRTKSFLHSNIFHETGASWPNKCAITEGLSFRGSRWSCTVKNEECR